MLDCTDVLLLRLGASGDGVLVDAVTEVARDQKARCEQMALIGLMRRDGQIERGFGHEPILVFRTTRAGVTALSLGDSVHTVH